MNEIPGYQEEEFRRKYKSALDNAVRIKYRQIRNMLMPPGWSFPAAVKIDAETLESVDHKLLEIRKVATAPMCTMTALLQPRRRLTLIQRVEDFGKIEPHTHCHLSQTMENLAEHCKEPLPDRNDLEYLRNKYKP